MKRFLYIAILFHCQFCFAQNWQSLIGCPNRYLNGFYEDTTTGKFYVTGTYSQISSNDYRGIATWSGTSWDSLGCGIDDTVATFPGNMHSVVRFGNDIVIGGAFRTAGTITSNFMARWNGTQWNSNFGGQPSDVVDGMLIHNGELYINGVFDSIGLIPTHGVAKWNGSAWESIYGNYDFNNAQDGIRKMIFYHGNLYVSGMFRDPWGTLCRLAKWNGSSWQFMVSEVQGTVAYIEDMVVYNDELYIGGAFYTSAGNIATCIMRWNDTLWRDVGGSVTVMNVLYPSVKDICIYNGKLYCVGNFERMGGIDARGIASWDGVDWCGYNTSFDLTPGQFVGAGCIGFYNDTMYIGGGFRWVDGDSIPFLAKWIGGSFIDTCGNLTGLVNHASIETEVTVYPNPSNSVTTFQFSGNAVERDISITDIWGRILWQEHFIDQKLNFPSSQYPGGIYFYHIRDENGVSINGNFTIAH